MKREVDISLITDGKKYTSQMLCKLGCKGCKGCHSCCEDRGDVITLDPYDLFMLSGKLHLNFDELLSKGYITVSMVDGLVLPVLSMKSVGTHDRCVFLNEEGRCDIHECRPGICRLFPLGRLYEEDESFSYIYQINECPNADGTKIKISKWLNIPDLRSYEFFIVDYHSVLRNVQNFLEDKEAELCQKVNMNFLSLFFRNPYDLSKDFYEQYITRKNMLL